MENVTPIWSYELTKTELRISALLDEIRKGLGTSEMTLDEMVLEMRGIRESSDYENSDYEQAATPNQIDD